MPALLTYRQNVCTVSNLIRNSKSSWDINLFNRMTDDLPRCVWYLMSLASSAWTSFEKARQKNKIKNFFYNLKLIRSNVSVKTDDKFNFFQNQLWERHFFVCLLQKQRNSAITDARAQYTPVQLVSFLTVVTPKKKDKKKQTKNHSRGCQGTQLWFTHKHICYTLGKT